MKFGEYLKSQRDARGWTQPMAAEKIGIEQSYLSKLETGKASPSEEMFERLVHAYDIDVDALGAAVAGSELERLREIGAIRDLVRRGQQATAQGRRRWLLPRLDPVVRWHAEDDDRGAYYIEPAEGGRRVFEKTGEWRHVPPRLNAHLGHALALAMLLFGFGGLFVARRW